MKVMILTFVDRTVKNGVICRVVHFLKSLHPEFILVCFMQK